MIEIGKIIYKVLDDNNIVSYPIIAPENSELPIVIYERSFKLLPIGRTINAAS